MNAECDNNNGCDPMAAEADQPTTDYDVLKALMVGCRQAHQPSIESARRVLTGLAAAPPDTMAEVLEVLLEGGVFTDEPMDPDDRVELTLSGKLEAAASEGRLVTEVAHVEKVPFTNSGHGHAWPRPDGIKARCGGPLSCQECAEDVDLRSRSATR